MTAMTNRERYIASFLVLLALLAFAAYIHLRSPLDGFWLKVHGSGYSEDISANEMSVRLNRDQFRIRFFKTEGTLEGLERITYLLDGREHTSSTMVDGSKVIYHAELDGSAVVITKHVETPSGTPVDWGAGTERWSISDGGRKLTVLEQASAQGIQKSSETVFQRAPFLRSVFGKTP
jgi:hypothetical protein